MELTVDLVARYPRPGTVVPDRVAYAPDGESIAYLQSASADLTRQLWRLDLASGRSDRAFTPPGDGVTDQNVSREEALRRERQRVREAGVTHYVTAEQAPVMLVPLGGALYRIEDGRADHVADGAIDPKISRDGRRIFFVRGGEVWCLDERGERQLTEGAEPGVTNGLAEFVAQEELSRHTGYWPSPDGRLVAYQRVDERHIPIYPIVHQARQPAEIEEHRYPFAGAANARVRLGVVPVDGGPTRWLDLGDDQDVYLARVDWHPDGRLIVQILARDQRRLDLWAYDVATGARVLLLTEQSELWVNLHHDLRFVETTGEFLWSSERTGFRHIYLYRADGSRPRQLTSGDWPVDAVLAVDPAQRWLYFAASVESPIERHVYRVGLDGGELTRLTTEPGTHGAVFAPDCASFVDTFSSAHQPPSMVVRRADGSAWRVVHEPAVVDLPPPELTCFNARDGTRLHAAIYHPPRATAPAPLIVAVYGGPHVQAVADRWDLTVDLRAQLLARHGYVVMKVDNRGSARRGHLFEGAIAGDLGEIELRDQVDGVRWLVDRGLANPDRVGIYGWSYGGYMSLLALVKAPEQFKVGVAGAPVTSWDGYDTGYTERYMRTPSGNPEGYRRSAVTTHVERLVGKLLLIHGMIDENVHFRHTARLVDALVKANKPHDLLVYPDERHMPRSERDRVSMEARILEYFEEHL